MNDFLMNAVGLTASMFGIPGMTGIFMMSIFLGSTVHPLLFGCVLLVPVWGAGAIAIMNWSYDRWA